MLPICSDLRSLLENYSSSKVYLFPGRHGLGHIHPDSADKTLRAAFLELGIEGASTHSFRRTCLTKMHMSGVPANAYYNRGLAYKNKGRKDKAVEDFKKVLELNDDVEISLHFQTVECATTPPQWLSVIGNRQAGTKNSAIR